MRRLGSVLLGLIVLLSSGCVPRCENVCEKLLACNLGSERVALEECTTSCLDQNALYEFWQDETKQQAFDDHRRCLQSSSCEEIGRGDCYDPEIFIFAVE